MQTQNGCLLGRQKKTIRIVLMQDFLDLGDDCVPLGALPIEL